MHVRQIDYSSVSRFAQRDLDYINGIDGLSEFIHYPFCFSSFSSVLENRKKIKTDRALLHSVIAEQYRGLEISPKTDANIQSLLDENTFTIITAHQPSLFTGPLYYIFKILSTINLTEQLKKEYSDCSFVPVFILGAEDHDFEEINHFHLFGNKVVWDKEASGPVGKYSVDGLDEVIQTFSDKFQNNENLLNFASELKRFAREAKNYNDFSLHLTHTLFDKFGLVIAGMDNPHFKTAFSPYIKKELLEKPSRSLVENTQQRLENLNYGPQAYARQINLFYFHNSQRLRIEEDNDLYSLVGSEKVFTKDEILNELDNHPEKFSPNVVMRPLYQELIFPNLAYIGGGGELAYWTERRSQFKEFGIHYPMLIRRNSAMIVTESHQKQIDKTGLTLDSLFQSESALIKLYLDNSDNADYKLEEYRKSLSGLFDSISQHSRLIDPSLDRLIQAEGTKAEKSIDYIEAKLKKSLKQKEDVQIKRIQKLVNDLFPSGLQERNNNIFQFIANYGFPMLDTMLEHMDPFNKKFLIFLMQPQDRDK